MPVSLEPNINAFITGVNNNFVHCTIFLIIVPGVVWPVGVILHIIKWKRLKALALAPCRRLYHPLTCAPVTAFRRVVLIQSMVS